VKVDLKFRDGIAMASFTKKQITSCKDILEISSMLCMSLSFSGYVDINPDNLPDEEVIEKLRPNVRYAVLAISRDSCNGRESDIAFGLEKDLLKTIF